MFVAKLITLHSCQKTSHRVNIDYSHFWPTYKIENIFIQKMTAINEMKKSATIIKQKLLYNRTKISTNDVKPTMTPSKAQNSFYVFTEIQQQISMKYF